MSLQTLWACQFLKDLCLRAKDSHQASQCTLRINMILSGVTSEKYLH